MSENVGMNAPDQVGDVEEPGWTEVTGVPIDQGVTVEAVEKIQEEARTTFSLRDRLKNGVKPKTRVVPLFLDEPAVEAYQAAKVEADAIFAQAERKGVKEDTRIALLDEHNKALDKVNALQAEILKNTISVHLASVPNKVVKATRAKMHLAAKAEAKGVPLTQEQIDELNERIARQVLALGIHKIVTSEGEAQVGATLEDVLLLEDELPTVQWERLYSAFEVLIFSQEAALAAVEEPGF